MGKSESTQVDVESMKAENEIKTLIKDLKDEDWTVRLEAARSSET